MDIKQLITQENAVHLKEFRRLVAEIIEPYQNTPDQCQIMQHILEDIISEETRGYTPLPFGNDAVTIHDKNLKVVEALDIDFIGKIPLS